MRKIFILRTKRALKIKQKAFFIIFKGLSVKQIKQFFLEGENLTLKEGLAKKPQCTLWFLGTGF